MERRMTAEDFRDRIKPLPPAMFEVGQKITRRALAAFIEKDSLLPESFGSSGRSKRVGNYMLDRQQWVNQKDLSDPDNGWSKTFLKFKLHDYSYQSLCTENGIIDCRVYTFLEDGAEMVCESVHNELLGFYDMMTLSDDGQSIMITT